MKADETKLMQCDTETGICVIPGSREQTATVSDERIEIVTPGKPVRLLYFTDPICSSCWGIEPQLRKLKLEYGEYFEIEYRMGGLLKSWESYGGRDVRSAAEVAQHWDEASLHYGMPIDGDVWIEDPLHSSYPPSIAFKAAQLQDEQKAVFFLRRIREMVFVEKKNITRWEHLAQAALETGLEVVQLKKDYQEKAKELFEEDLTLARAMGVRGFPTFFFTDAEGNQFKVYGSKPYEVYAQALLKLVPDAQARPVPASYETVLNRFGTLTTKEFAELNNRNIPEAENFLQNLEAQNKVKKINTKNGSLWRMVI